MACCQILADLKPSESQTAPQTTIRLKGCSFGYCRLNCIQVVRDGNQTISIYLLLVRSRLLHLYRFPTQVSIRFRTTF